MNRSKMTPVRFGFLVAILFAAGQVCCAGVPATATPEDSPANAERLEVGTFCAAAPYGMTLLVDRGAAFVLDPGLLGAGEKTAFAADDEAWAPAPVQAPDGSYVFASGKVDNANVTVSFGWIGTTAAGEIFSADAPATLTVQLRQPWSGCKTIYWKDDSGVDAYGIAANTGKYTKLCVRLQPPPVSIAANYSSEGSITIKLLPNQPAMLIASIGDLPDFSTVQPALARAAANYAASRATAEGIWGDFLTPIADSLNGSRLFSSLDRRVVHVVGRGWWIYHQVPINGDCDLGPYFCWDSFFNGMLANIDDPQHARDTVRAALSLESPEGIVANCMHWGFKGNYVSSTRSQPPVGSLCVWKMYQRWPDNDFLRDVYPRLVKWHDWWHTQRSPDDSYLLAWGSNDGAMQGARFETGWDDTPAFRSAKMGKTCLNAYAVDLSSLWAMDAEYLALIADTIGQTKDAARFRAERERMAAAINARLWNEQLGMYCHRIAASPEHPDGGDFLTRISPMNFYPLIAGIPDAARAKLILQTLTDPHQFWGHWMIPTLPYTDPDWHRQNYWRGHVWPPVNYLIFQGVKRYDPQAAAELADKSVNLFMHNWQSDKKICGENYRSDNGSLGDDPHYTWGALLPYIAVEELADVGPDLRPVARPMGQLSGPIVARRVPFGGRLYDIQVKDGSTQISPSIVRKDN